MADGICIRLYSESDFERRAAYTDPEILRTNLGSVILQMTMLGLGEIAAFPFIDPPDTRAITDGVRLLEELGAFQTPDRYAAQPDPIDTRHRITPLGRTLAQLPIDPRLARMLVEADRQGCLAQVIVVVAALSIQDPRERPQDRQEAAALAHKRFADEHSDFVAYLQLWEHLREQQRALSGSAFRRMCRNEFLHYLRVREWQDLVSQLRQACRSAGFAKQLDRRERRLDPGHIDPGAGAGPGHTAALHRALLLSLIPL